MPISPNDPDYNRVMANHRRDVVRQKELQLKRVRGRESNLQKRLEPS